MIKLFCEAGLLIQGIYTDTELYLQVDSNMKLGEWAGLCKIDREGVCLNIFKECNI